MINKLTVYLETQIKTATLQNQDPHFAATQFIDLIHLRVLKQRMFSAEPAAQRLGGWRQW